MSSQALRTAVVQAIVSDAAFRSEVEKDAAKAIEARFGKQSYALNVVVEGENELNLLVPEKTEQLARSLERVAQDAGDRKPTRGQFEAMLVLRAWNDAAFSKQLSTDPRGTLQGELSRFGGSLPAGRAVRVHHEQAGQCVVVIPRPAATSSDAELTEAELEAVAGGEAVVTISVVTIAGGVLGGVASAIVGEWVCGPAKPEQQQL
jgi:hypothetical protein